MNSENDDVKLSLEKFRSIFQNLNNYRINETNMWALIENLIEDLELSKQRANCLQKNLMNCLESDTADITTKFVSLKEKYEATEKENAEIKIQFNQLRTQMAVDAEKQRDEFMQNIAKVEEKYNSEISKLREQIQCDQNRFGEKEKKLYNELQLAQAAAALQYDELECNLKRQLVDTNNKLRNARNIISNLNMDILNLRNQLTTQQTQSYDKPAKPEMRFQPLPVTTVRQTFNYESESDEQEFFERPPSTNITVTPQNRNNFYSGVTPLHRANTSMTEDSWQQSSTPLVFRSGRNQVTTNPPVTSTTKIRRKRKLYDPDSFDQSNLPTF